jgi:hypothetical protein
MPNSTAPAAGGAMPAEDPSASLSSVAVAFLTTGLDLIDGKIAAARGRRKPMPQVLLERALICTPAPLSFMVWAKWELLEKLMTDEQENGPDAWSLAIITAAALKADILSLGLRDGREPR